MINCFNYINAYVLYPFLESIQKRDILSKLNLLKKDSLLPFNERLQIRRKKLIEILNIAKNHVPYYRDLFRHIGFDPDKVEKDIAYFYELPYLTKEIIREQGNRLLNDKYPKNSLHIRKTGGSTGPSALIYYSQGALDWTAATNLFVLEWTGKKRHMKEVHLSSRFPETFPLKDRIKEYIKCMALNRVNIMTDSFDYKALKKVWNKLKKVKPYLIQGHPSTLYALALFVKETENRGEGIIKVFESTGELLDKKKREVIKDVFNCQIFNRYGNAEFGVVAYQTKENSDKLKVIDYMVWPEILQIEGDTYEIVLTGLTNDAMPLIRYRTGDLGTLEKQEDGFYLKNIQGRIHEVVKIGDKNYPTHYIQDLLDRIGGVDEFQIEIRDNAPLLLRLVVSEESARDNIKHHIKSWWNNDVEIEFTDFNGLKRVGWREKFKYVISSKS